MTNKQPDPLALADEVDEVAKTFPDMAEVSACIRTQHAEIERLNAAATDSNLILERAQATNLEMLAAIERKDALLRQALETLCCETSENMDDPGHRCGHCDDYIDRNGTLRSAITKELSQ